MLKQESFTTKRRYQRQQIMYQGGWNMHLVENPSLYKMTTQRLIRAIFLGQNRIGSFQVEFFMNFSFERSTRTNHSHESLARILLKQCVYPSPIGPISTKWVGLWYIYHKNNFLKQQCVYPTLKAAHHYKMSWPMMWLQQACSQAMCVPHSYHCPSLWYISTKTTPLPITLVGLCGPFCSYEVVHG